MRVCREGEHYKESRRRGEHGRMTLRFDREAIWHYAKQGAPLYALDVDVYDQLSRGVPECTYTDRIAVRYNLEAAFVGMLVRNWHFLDQGHLTGLCSILLSNAALDRIEVFFNMFPVGHLAPGDTLLTYLYVLENSASTMSGYLELANTFFYFIVARELSRQGASSLAHDDIETRCRTWALSRDVAATQLEHLQKCVNASDAHAPLNPAAYALRWEEERRLRAEFMKRLGKVYNGSRHPVSDLPYFAPSPCPHTMHRRWQPI